MAITHGKFITIEGQDGAGKSTNINVVEAWLNAQGIEYVKTREPGGTEFGEQIRDLILSSDTGLIGQKAELLLMFASRAQHIQEVIQPTLSSGRWVLCDRFTDATYAYQGGGRGESVDDINALKKVVQGELNPDLTLLLDLPIELGESRANARSEPDRFEQEQAEFKQRVRDSYLRLANDDPERIKVIDASRSIDAVEQDVLAVLESVLGSTDN